MREALIVGGANGIGLAIATLLAEDERFGRIHIVDRTEVAEEHRNTKFVFTRFDLRAEDYSIFDTFNDVDTLIITAGFGRLAHFADVEEQHIVDSFDVNSIAPLRIIHHLYYNYTHELFERTFVQDTYSCIPGRGTHYGIERLKRHILTESNNYGRRCWAMSLDIRGYFMHIDRNILLGIATDTIKRMATHSIDGTATTWQDVIDIPFVLWMTEKIIMLDPKSSCKIVGKPEEWEGLDLNKSLFHTPDGCGLPIGNLTSQLFSNVYLNAFDQHMKRDLRCRHYGRYVDDAYVVSTDKEWLLSLIPQIDCFLQERLHLQLHRGKTQLREVSQGVEFLGGFVKPHRTYMSHHAEQRLRRSVERLPMNKPDKLFRSVNAMLGVLAHYDSHRLRHELFDTDAFHRVGYFDRDMTQFFLR